MATINTLLFVSATMVSMVAGVIAGLVVGKKMVREKVKSAEERARTIVANAEQEAERQRREAAVEAQERLHRSKMEIERETKERRGELVGFEKRLAQREASVERRREQLERRETELSRREKEVFIRERSVTEKDERVTRMLKEQKEQMEKIAGLTAEEARKFLMEAAEREARADAARLSKKIEDEARQVAEQRAREVIVTSIQRVARDFVSEATISVVPLPTEEMKGRIIGREGRNIRALEGAVGVDLIIDDTPEAVLVSSFDPMRREIAKISLERLIADGRIHPARIEEVVEKVKKEVEQGMIEEAERILFELGIHDLHSELVRLLGRLKFRTSYGQNNLSHAREASFIAGMMAAELGLDVKLARRGTLLHDIGKAVSHQEEGTHAAIGADLARKYGESPKVVNSIAAHHDEVEHTCPESVLVAAAESLSAARPGARRESLDAYLKRLEKLEKIASAFKGVEKAYAIQAGREIRIIVDPSGVSDAESALISREVAKKIEQEVVFPGQIKVTVIREGRFVEYAR